MAPTPLTPPRGANRPRFKRKGVATGGAPTGPARPRTGLRALKAAVRVRGLAAIDRRTAPARALIEWHTDLLADLGGTETVSAAQRALIEDAVRTRLFLDHVDAFLLERSSLIVKRRRQRDRVMPLVIERTRLADHLMQVLTRLGLERRAPKVPDLSDYLARHYPGAAAAPAPAPGSAAPAAPSRALAAGSAPTSRASVPARPGGAWASGPSR